MLEVYWGALSFGVIFAIITIFFGDIIGSMFDGVFDSFSPESWSEPVILVGGVTIFGGTGVILESYTDCHADIIVILSLLAAVALSGVVYFIYVRPMKGAENSTIFFIKELIGKQGEVIIPIPAAGYGEVLIKMVGGNTSQIAACSERLDIPAGALVVVRTVRDGVLYVSRKEENAEEQV
ncbi:protease [Sporomusa sphaeroides]|uniref:protease n=1 Tax=Sporomusa sphaeroides TaxID=47679 RepID=UPI0031594FC9